MTYDSESYLMVFRLRGRNLPHVLKPLALTLCWFVSCILVIEVFPSARASVEAHVRDDLVGPLLVPVSFMLVFRLSRASVRYWDARAAIGSIVSGCRTISSTALAGCAGNAPLQAEFARWLAAFPCVVKNFLRPISRRHWDDTQRLNKQRFELGALLSDAEAESVNVSSDGGGAASYGPLTVLTRLRCLALDTLTSAWGTCERINSTPLPFVYVVHLRTFLMLYLLLWCVEAAAQHGWGALPVVTVTSFALLGIEAASVECERPFRWEANHLSLGKMCVVAARNVAQTMAVVEEASR